MKIFNFQFSPQEYLPRRGSTIFKNEEGFTLIELLLAIGIAAILLSLTTFSLLNAQRSTSLTTAKESFIADLKSQQIKAMNGINGASGTTSFGIHFAAGGSNIYTLFQGTSLAASISTSSVTADSNISYSCTSGCSAANDLIFSKISGEIGTATTITVKNTTDNSTKTIQLNKYGVIIAD